MSSLLSRLRGETAELHQHVERQMPVLRDQLTRGDYARLLARLLSVYQPLESAHAALPIPAVFDLPSRRKVPLLKADLKRLGQAELSGPVPLSLPDTVPAALGTLYVLEGATLGGQVIARHLRRVLDVGPDNGGRFFHGYGSDTGPMWRTFGAALDGASPPEHHDEVVAGARLGFSLFAAVLA